MSFKLKRSKKMRASLDMTPFLDIVFLLNIFFMLTASFTPNAALEVELPNASTAAVVEMQKDLYVTIDKFDNYKFKKKKIKLEELKAIFTAEAKLPLKKEVIIVADKLSSHGAVVNIMELAKQTGLNKFSIAVKKKDGTEYASL